MGRGVATVQTRAPTGLPLGLATARRLGGRFAEALSFVGFVALWQMTVASTDINPILLPSPGSVVDQFIEAWQLNLLLPAVGESLSALAVGLAVALVVGVILGLAIGAFRWLDLVSSPYLYGMFATPTIALMPLFVLWLGFGSSIKTLLVVLGAVVPLTLSVKEGVQTVDESLMQAARSFGASRLDLFRKVVVPFTLPFIANGIRNGISRGFVGLLIVEMRVGSGGIGTQVMRSMRTFNTARMFAYVAVLVITALTLIMLSRLLEARISRWREEVYV
jgi:ABC-type nitrate/sulfonate/bicarbonate transport system permease component